MASCAINQESTRDSPFFILSQVSLSVLQVHAFSFRFVREQNFHECILDTVVIIT